MLWGLDGLTLVARASTSTIWEEFMDLADLLVIALPVPNCPNLCHGDATYAWKNHYGEYDLAHLDKRCIEQYTGYWQAGAGRMSTVWQQVGTRVAIRCYPPSLYLYEEFVSHTGPILRHQASIPDPGLGRAFRIGRHRMHHEG